MGPMDEGAGAKKSNKIFGRTNANESRQILNSSTSFWNCAVSGLLNQASQVFPRASVIFGLEWII